MKRVLLIVVLALAFQGDGHAQGSGVFWTCSVDDVADAYTVCIGPTEPGMRRYITDVVAQSTTAVADVFNIGYDATASCGGDPAADQLFPPIDNAVRFVAPANTSAPTVAALGTPMIVPPGKNLCVVGGATSTVTVQVSGYVAP